MVNFFQGVLSNVATWLIKLLNGTGEAVESLFGVVGAIGDLVKEAIKFLPSPYNAMTTCTLAIVIAIIGYKFVKGK